MRSISSKVSAAVLGAIVATSSSLAFAIPATPWPNTSKSSKLAAIPATPWPNTGKSSKLAAIPATPWPNTSKSQLVSL